MGDGLRRTTHHRAMLGVILLIATAGFGIGIGWGLPQGINPETVEPWALDTVAPIAPLNEAYHRYTRAGTENVVYPLFHFVVLGGAYAPYLGMGYLTGNLQNPSSTFPYGLQDVQRFCQDLTIIARLVSIAMALGIVLLIYKITSITTNKRVALWAAVATSLIAPLSYYAKTSNLDVPYSFWACLAVWMFVRVLDRQNMRDYTLLGVFVALAVATKDQAYGFFVLIPFALAFAQAKQGSQESATASALLRALFSKPMLLGGAAAVLTYGAANNAFLGGWDGLVRHLTFGETLYDYRVESTGSFYGIVEQTRLGGRTLLILVQMLGPVSMVLAAWGIVLTWRDRNWKLLSLLLFSISYYLSVIVVFSLVFSRYMIVSAVLLTPFIGVAIEHLRSSASRLSWRAVAAAALIPQAALVANLNLTLIGDSRNAMSAWIDRNVVSGAVIESQVRQRMLPHIRDDIRVAVAGNSQDVITGLAVSSELTPDALAQRDPDYVLILEGLGVTGDPAGWEEPALRDYYEGLIAGDLGYEEVARFETRSFVPWRQIPGTRPTSILLARIGAGGPGE